MTRDQSVFPESKFPWLHPLHPPDSGGRREAREGDDIKTKFVILNSPAYDEIIRRQTREIYLQEARKRSQKSSSDD